MPNGPQLQCPALLLETALKKLISTWRCHLYERQSALGLSQRRRIATRCYLTYWFISPSYPHQISLVPVRCQMQPLVGVLQKQLDNMEGALTARCIFDPQRPQGQDNFYRPHLRPMPSQSLLVQPVTSNSLLFQICIFPSQMSNFKNLHEVILHEVSCFRERKNSAREKVANGHMHSNGRESFAKAHVSKSYKMMPDHHNMTLRQWAPNGWVNGLVSFLLNAAPVGTGGDVWEGSDPTISCSICGGEPLDSFTEPGCLGMLGGQPLRSSPHVRNSGSGFVQRWPRIWVLIRDRLHRPTFSHHMYKQPWPSNPLAFWKAALGLWFSIDRVTFCSRPPPMQKGPWLVSGFKMFQTPGAPAIRWALWQAASSLSDIGAWCYTEWTRGDTNRIGQVWTSPNLQSILFLCCFMVRMYLNPSSILSPPFLISFPCLLLACASQFMARQKHRYIPRVS